MPSHLLKKILTIVKERIAFGDESWQYPDRMVDFLLTLRDFKRNKRNPLKRVVEEAIGILKKEFAKKQIEISENDMEVEHGDKDDSFDDDKDDNDDDDASITSSIEDLFGKKVMIVPNNNILNATLMKTYNSGETAEIASNDAVEKDPITKPEDSSLEQQQQPALKKRRKNDKTPSSRRKSRSSGDVSKQEISFVERPKLRFKDLGGISSCLRDIRELIEYPMRHTEIYKHLGVEPPRGVLLHGPPGTGKTSLALAIAGELDVPFIRLSAPEIVSGMSGESEARLREIFKEAKTNAPCLIFIDEIDAVTPKRETAQREMERRIVAQLLTCMDELTLDQTDGKPVIIIGATNRPDSLDPALRRAGRFDREIRMGIPDVGGRQEILELLCKKMRLCGAFDFLSLAKRTPGYVGADLKSLTREAAMHAVQRIIDKITITESYKNQMEECDNAEQIENSDQIENSNQIENSYTSSQNDVYLPQFMDNHLDSLSIEMSDFEVALTKVQPSAKREGFAVVPDTTWDDIGALDHVREELRMAIVEPIRHPETFESVGLSAPVGVLLWGPPGCGKTLLARAIANESHSNFISVKGPELLNKFVGESERSVRQVFERAKSSAPCVIFFDELDALCPKRSDESNNHSARIVNQLLTEMDGMEGRKQVFIIAATNRPDMIDPAMIRPGRLDKLLYVQLPKESERLEILKTVTRKTPLDPNLDLKNLAIRSKSFTGADLSSLVREASVSALKRSICDWSSPMAGQNIKVTDQDFDTAFEKVFPSVSVQDQNSYDRLLKDFGRYLIR